MELPRPDTDSPFTGSRNLFPNICPLGGRLKKPGPGRSFTASGRVPVSNPLVTVACPSRARSPGGHRAPGGAAEGRCGSGPHGPLAAFFVSRALDPHGPPLTSSRAPGVWHPSTAFDDRSSSDFGAGSRGRDLCGMAPVSCLYQSTLYQGHWGEGRGRKPTGVGSFITASSRSCRTTSGHPPAFSDPSGVYADRKVQRRADRKVQRSQPPARAPDRTMGNPWKGPNGVNCW